MKTIGSRLVSLMLSRTTGFYSSSFTSFQKTGFCLRSCMSIRTDRFPLIIFTSSQTSIVFFLFNVVLDVVSIGRDASEHKTSNYFDRLACVNDVRLLVTVASNVCTNRSDFRYYHFQDSPNSSSISTFHVF